MDLQETQDWLTQTGPYAYPFMTADNRIHAFGESYTEEEWQERIRLFFTKAIPDEDFQWYAETMFRFMCHQITGMGVLRIQKTKQDTVRFWLINGTIGCIPLENLLQEIYN